MKYDDGTHLAFIEAEPKKEFGFAPHGLRYFPLRCFRLMMLLLVGRCRMD